MKSTCNFVEILIHQNMDAIQDETCSRLPQGESEEAASLTPLVQSDIL